MRLHIEHVTAYAYAVPVTFHRHRLVVRPREGHDLRIERFGLQLAPRHRVQWIRDVFGNSIALVDWLEPADLLRIATDVVVERTVPFPERDLHEPWRVPYPPRYDPLEAPVIAPYVTPPGEAPRLRDWLRAGFVADAGDAEGSMLTLCRLVRATIQYQHRSEKGVQSPEETLARQSGSCRDMATLLMEAARQCGVAARFASGYHHGAASVAGRASTHAWTEVYLPTLGWRGFDPTVGGPVTAAHVVTGVSHHPRGVMPVSGSYHGRAHDFTALQVTVTSSELTTVP